MEQGGAESADAARHHGLSAHRGAQRERAQALLRRVRLIYPTVTSDLSESDAS